MSLDKFFEDMEGKKIDYEMKRTKEKHPFLYFVADKFGDVVKRVYSFFNRNYQNEKK